MRVLFFSPFAQWSHHLGTELDLIQKHLDAGDDVTVFGCLRDVTACTANIDNSRTGCAKCITRRLRGFEVLRDPSNRLDVAWLRDWLEPKDRANESEVVVGFTDPHTAASVEADGWDIGSAAASSAISKFRDPEFESAESRDGWERLLLSAYRSRRAVANWLAAHPDTGRAYIFNGRFAMARGALRACESAGIEFLVHDRGRNDDHYSAFVNHVLFDQQKFGALVEQAWDVADEVVRETEGAAFFETLRAGRPTHVRSFTQDQTPGLLPDDWSDSQRNVVVFVSSEDEFASIGPDWRNPVYDSQAAGIDHLVGTTGPETAWWIRMHPNLAGVDNKSTRALWALADKGVKILESTSAVSTYSLIDAADVVLTFGSTVGVEATYWGRPSVRVGPSLYQDLDVTYSASTPDEAAELIATVSEPKSKLGAMKYGHYWRTYGEKFQYFASGEGSEGTFNGHEIAELPTPHRFIAEYVAPLASKNPKLYAPVYRATKLLLHSPFVPAGRAWRSRQSSG